MSKKTTCGVLITDGNLLLICHPTGQSYWDIPKGRQDPGETHVQTALRELREETGIRLTADLLEDLGVHDYKPHKDLALFRYHTTALPKLEDCWCFSEFEDDEGRLIPEMDGYALIGWPDAIAKMNQDMARVLSSL
jgi:8-oxo-dGTP pyrophosphatase MutT (NUDIX family)